MGEKFEVIATNTLEDQVFIATPVIAGVKSSAWTEYVVCISERSELGAWSFEVSSTDLKSQSSKHQTQGQSNYFFSEMSHLT